MKDHGRLPDFDTKQFDAAAVDRFNDVRVARAPSLMDIGDLDRGVMAAGGFQPGDIVCGATLERSLARGAHSITCLDGSGAPFDGEVTAPLRLLNHSCIPSLLVVPVPTDGIGSLSHVVLAASEIKPGEELTFAYHQTELEIVAFDVCRCSGSGSSRCVRRIDGWRALSVEWQGYYRRLFADLDIPFPSYLA